MSGAFIWLITGVALVVIVVMVISMAVKKGKNPGLPTTKPYDTQDSPPSDAEISARK